MNDVEEAADSLAKEMLAEYIGENMRFTSHELGISESQPDTPIVILTDEFVARLIGMAYFKGVDDGQIRAAKKMADRLGLKVTA